MPAGGVVERSVRHDGVEYILVEPGQAPRHPGVVFIHGLGCHRDECRGLFRELAHRIAADAVPSVRFDLPRHAGRSEGTEPFTLERCVLEVIGAIDVVAAECGPAPGNSGPLVCGASFGGAVALAASAAADDRVGSLVLLDPVGDFRVLTGGERARQRRLSDALVNGSDVAWDWGVTITAALNAELHTVDLPAMFARVSCPTVVVHGEEDDVVPIGVSRRLVAANPRARLISLPNTGHVLAEVGDAEGAGERSQANVDLVAGLLTRSVPPAR